MARAVNRDRGTARGNLAWVEWREGKLDEAEENGRSALESWQQTSTPHPMQWVAFWPLLGVAVARDQISKAVNHARALLDPLQQKQPDALETALQETIREWERDQPEAARTYLDQAIRTAQEMGYL